MKIRDIMAANGGNLSWCKPMMDDHDNAIVMMEGKAINAIFDGVEFGGYNREKLDRAKTTNGGTTSECLTWTSPWET